MEKNPTKNNGENNPILKIINIILFIIFAIIIANEIKIIKKNKNKEKKYEIFFLYLLNQEIKVSKKKYYYLRNFIKRTINNCYLKIFLIIKKNFYIRKSRHPPWLLNESKIFDTYLYLIN